jgi:hypothetical protein
MDGSLDTGYVHQIKKDRDNLSRKYTDGRARSESVRARVKGGGFVPMSQFLSGNGCSSSSRSSSAKAQSAMAMSSATSSGVSAVGADQEMENKEEEEKEDLEVEEVFIEKKLIASAFDDLARLA